MRQITINHNNGHSTTYNLIDGGKDKPIAYREETPILLWTALEYARKNRIRVRIYLGDPITGKCWNEEHDIFGYIGLSKGKDAYFPILVYNSRSMGGGSLMDDNIIKLVSTNPYQTLFKTDNFIKPQVEIKLSTEEGYTHSVYIDGELYSNHKTIEQAERLQKKMQ